MIDPPAVPSVRTAPVARPTGAANEVREPLRILLAAHGFPPNQSAGAEWRAHRTARFLAGAGHPVRVVAVDRVEAGGDQGVRVRDDVVDGIPVRRLSFGADARPGQVAEFDNPRVGAAVAEVIAAFRPDVVHVISGYRLTASAIDAAAAAGVPIVVTLTDYWFLCPRITLRRATGELCAVPDDVLECVHCLASEQRRYRVPHRWTGGWSGRALVAAWRSPLPRPRRIDDLHAVMRRRRRRLAESLALAARVIAPSRFLARMFAARGVPDAKLVPMRQGLDVAGWEPAGDLGARRAVHIGYIGQVTEQKGIFDLVRAVRRLPYDERSVRLFVHGDVDRAWPANRERLQRAIADDPRVTLAGPFANREIRRVHANLDVLAVPSRWYENSPNVILEAFACGTPVVAAGLGGMAELVADGENGLLFDPGDVDALAGRLRRLIDDPALRDRLRAGIPPVRTLADEMVELRGVYATIAEGHVLRGQPPCPAGGTNA